MVNLSLNANKRRCSNGFVKKKAKSFNLRSIGIEKGKVFINNSLCCYYMFLWSKCKTLCSEKQDETFWVSIGQIKIRNEPEVPVSQINHITVLQKLFLSHGFQLK